jgi:hypothetical protein
MYHWYLLLKRGRGPAGEDPSAATGLVSGHGPGSADRSTSRRMLVLGAVETAPVVVCPMLGPMVTGMTFGPWLAIGLAGCLILSWLLRKQVPPQPIHGRASARFQKESRG